MAVAPPRVPLLELEGVSKRFGAVQALTDVRFDVFAGPIVDNQGNEILAEGEKMVQADLDQFPNEAGDNCETCMYWWNENITAELPELE